jgi:hypothetical protein
MNILTLNLVFSTAIFAIIARLYVTARLDEWDLRTVLRPILVLHSFRHLGLMFLEPGATVLGIAPEFAYPAAYGDFLASLLALAALFALQRESRYALPLIWIFNIEGSVDLLLAIVLASLHQAVHFMGPAYWIPALWVPALLVTHYLAFRMLVRKIRGRSEDSASSIPSPAPS